MNNVKSLAVAVAAAIGATGVGVAQADEVLFPYVVSSNTVTTVLTVVNTFEPSNPDYANKLHFHYWYKEGASATDNAAKCVEINRDFTSSYGDLIDVDVDKHYGASTRGILFNDPSTNATYAPTTSSPALLAGLTKPVRAFAMVDNNNRSSYSSGRAGPDGTLLAARATILEFVNGAAWGYAGYNAINFNPIPATGVSPTDSSSVVGSYTFSEAQERFGEVFGGVNGTTSTAQAAFSFKPFSANEFTTMFFVTPVAGDYTFDTDGFGEAGMGTYSQATGNLKTRVLLTAESDSTVDVATDRDENRVSGRVPQDIVCVGAVTVQDLLTTGAQLQLKETGGWSMIRTTWPSTGSLSGDTYLRTNEAMVLFLEHNGTGSDFNGQELKGVVNNGYLLQED